MCNWLTGLFLNADGQFDMTIVWMALGVLATSILAGVAVWQGRMANATAKQATKVAERALREKMGLFFLQKLNPLCTAFDLSLKQKTKNGYVLRLENRGNDLIHDMEVLRFSINDYDCPQDSIGALFEISEPLYLNFDMPESLHEERCFEFSIIFKLCNSVGYEYYQILKCTLSRDGTENDTFSIHSYGLWIKYSLKDAKELLNIPSFASPEA